MGTKVGEVFVDFAVKLGDAAKLKDFAGSIADIPVSAVAGIAALGGMSLGFLELTKDTLNMANGIMMFNAQTGEATDSLERWEMAGRRVGVQNEAVSGSFNRMMAAIAQLKTFGTGPAGEMFGRLGIHGFMQKTPDALMSELREKYRNLHSPQEIQKFMQVAGSLIDPSMARVFQGPDPASMHPLLGKGGLEASQQLVAALAELKDVISIEFIGVFKRIEPEMASIAKFLGFIVETVGKAAGNAGRIVDLGEQIHRYGTGKFFAEQAMRLFPSHTLAQGFMWQPARHNISVTQHFHGDVDRDDIDAGTLSLEHSLIRTSRQLNKGGR